MQKHVLFIQYSPSGSDETRRNNLVNFKMNGDKIVLLTQLHHSATDFIIKRY